MLMIRFWPGLGCCSLCGAYIPLAPLILRTALRRTQIIAMSVIIFGFWNVPVVRNLINPLKLFTIGWHELCHVSAVRHFSYHPTVCVLISPLCDRQYFQEDASSRSRSTRMWAERRSSKAARPRLHSVQGTSAQHY